jgi:hypothetical protein
MAPIDNQAKIERIIQAFGSEEPPLVVNPQTDVFAFQGRVGIRAENATASHQPGRVKRAYYVEGSHYEMGYLLGLMAEPEVSRMCTEFNKKVLFEFVDVRFRSHRLADLLGEFMEILLYWLSANIYPDIPAEYRMEMEGILDGCRASNPETRVDWQELWVMNVGVDALLSYAYTGNLPLDRRLPLMPSPEHLVIPLSCNAFSVAGPAAEGNGHFLGRDFMFPTAGVYQDTAAHIVQNPIVAGAEEKHAFVNMTAPGMVGCVAGMNSAGLGVGVDMSPAGNCNPARPGFNSTLLIRHCVENAETSEQAVELMVEAQRGVSWNYILADYQTQRACVVEAGASMEYEDLAGFAEAQMLEHPELPSYSELPQNVFRNLPDRYFVELHRQAEMRNGLMARWNDYQYPVEYLQFNEKLFKLFKKEYDPAAFGPRGYINPSWKSKNCPKGYYFAPQRETEPNMVLVTNMYIIPEMRLFAMHPWSNLMAASQVDDLQWRYDELNAQLLERLYPDPDGPLVPLSLESAKDLADYLTPDPDKGRHPEYYNPEPETSGWRAALNRLRASILGGGPVVPAQADWRTIVIEGSVSLMDLKARTIYSHYGYYGDEWLSLRLQEYV